MALLPRPVVFAQRARQLPCRDINSFQYNFVLYFSLDEATAAGRLQGMPAGNRARVDHVQASVVRRGDGAILEEATVRAPTAEPSRTAPGEARCARQRHRERRRVARDLRDDVGPALAYLQRALATLETSETSRDRVAELRALQGLAAAATETVGTLVLDLVLPLLHEPGLEWPSESAVEPAGERQSGAGARIRVVVGDGHEVFCEGMRSLVAGAEGLAFVGCATDGRRALDLALGAKPDVAVINVSLPGLDGLEVTRRIRSGAPATSVVCLSSRNEEAVVSAALGAGAAGCLLRDCSADEVVEAVRTVHATGSYFSSAVASTMVQGYVERVGGRTASCPSLSWLTARERQTLQLISDGYATKQIADKLGVSIKTVSTHREHLMRKLELHSIAGLTKFAIRHGLTSVDREGPA